MRLLLISNSTMQGQPFLYYPKAQIMEFLGEKPLSAVFIPYAAVTFSYDEYEKKVQDRFSKMGHRIISIHNIANKEKALKEAEAIIVGGGNTWHLVRELHRYGLMNSIRTMVKKGTPYIGWSAGANIASPTLKTTNDMPIVDPFGFDTLGIIPFQINPHYIDANPIGFSGETRQKRIEEFIEINQKVYVVGLREGCMLLQEDNKLHLIGSNAAKIFHHGKAPFEAKPKDDLSFLLL